MAKTESTFKNMVVVLTLISAVAAVALGGVYTLTKEPIELSQKAKISDAIKKVVPEFDQIQDTSIMPEEGDKPLIFHKLSKGGQFAGVAIETYTEKGFSGHIGLMVGILPDGSISNIEVLDHKETPGLGTKMADAKFKDPFKGLKISEIPNETLKVKKDGGTVDAITAATISSRAFCDAVNRAYKTNKKGGLQ